MIADLKPYAKYKESGLPWLGRVPGNWGALCVKQAFDIQLGKMLQNAPRTMDDSSVPYLKSQHVQWSGVRTSDLPRMWASPREMIQFGVRSGDLLVCEGGEGGRCAVLKSIPPGVIIQNALHRVRPRRDNDNRFLSHAMAVVSSVGWFDAISNKATVAHFTRDKFGSLGIPLPTPAEQAAIVRFLDWSNGRLDRAIRAKRRLIELLNEQKQAIIQRAVTRGLDPSVRLKASGIDWLPAIPEHWSAIRLGSIAQSLQTGPFGSQLHASEYQPNGMPVINPSHMSEGRLNPDPACAVGTSKAGELRRHRLQAGDIVFARRGELGRCALVTHQEEGWLCGTGSLRMRTRGDLADPEYLVRLFLSKGVAQWLSLQSVGSTMENLNPAILSRLPLPLPPRGEQGTILGYITEQRVGLDNALQLVRCEMDLVREYRIRLVADVVTGKLDVRGVELPQLEETEELAPAHDEVADDATEQADELEPVEDTAYAGD